MSTGFFFVGSRPNVKTNPGVNSGRGGCSVVLRYV